MEKAIEEAENAEEGKEAQNPEKLVKKGDTRHVIDLPATLEVEATAGNIFGVAYAQALETPDALDATNAAHAGQSQVGRARTRFGWMRMPLFIRLWGRS